MRLLLFITLMISMVVAPTAALASCASMGSGADMAAMPPDTGGMKMAHDGCADMTDETGQSHDRRCAAACALVCPGFYAGFHKPAENAPALAFAKHITPATGPGVAIPSHLDPPPPRI